MSRVLVLFLTIFSGFGCLTALAGPVPITQPYYYEVSYQGHVSHVLGTMHVGFDVSDLPPQISNDLKSATHVFAEKNMDSRLLREQLDDFSSFYLSYLRDRDSRFSSCRLTSEERDKLRSLGVPSAIASLVTCDDYSYFFIDAQYVFPKVHSMDYEILDLAARYGKPVHELDAGRLRENAHRAAGEQTSAQLTKSLIDTQSVEQLLAGSRKTQIAYAAHHVSCDVSPSVTYRNAAWSKDRALLKELANGSAFVAVGAAHLGCQNGLLHLLKQEGFTVKPVFSNPNKRNRAQHAKAP